MEVDVTLILGFDEESERILKLAREAAKILRDEYGIWAYIIPTTAWRSSSSLFSEPWVEGDKPAPRLYVNGNPVPLSSLNTAEDLADSVVGLLRARREYGEVPLRLQIHVPRSPEAAPAFYPA